MASVPANRNVTSACRISEPSSHVRTFVSRARCWQSTNGLDADCLLVSFWLISAARSLFTAAMCQYELCTPAVGSCCSHLDLQHSSCCAQYAKRARGSSASWTFIGWRIVEVAGTGGSWVRIRGTPEHGRSRRLTTGSISCGRRVLRDPALSQWPRGGARGSVAQAGGLAFERDHARVVDEAADEGTASMASRSVAGPPCWLDRWSWRGSWRGVDSLSRSFP